MIIRSAGWLAVLVAGALAACGTGGSSSAPGREAIVATQWTWMGGDAAVLQAGSFGTKGVAADANLPPARNGAASWTDGAGRFWLFGGSSIDGAQTWGYRTDLWKFDGRWTWVSGDSTLNSTGSYGTKGTAAASNVPRARVLPCTWTDGSGNLWLFGGQIPGGAGTLNDLWKFDGASWTWVGGTSAANQSGTWGTQGVPDTGNLPEHRRSCTGWTDGAGKLWLFGGETYMGSKYDDLWRFDPSAGTWTFVAGTMGYGATGAYGLRGTADAANHPGGRAGASGWVDGAGKFWIFGGGGYDASAANRALNDLWRFDPTGGLWTWMGGSSTGNQPGTYGTRGTAAASNAPGGRTGQVSWVDHAGHVWLLGGIDGASGLLDDLWKLELSTQQWTWVAGDDVTSPPRVGRYGTQGVAAATNTPGGRQMGATWVSATGDLWLFGGMGYATDAGSIGLLDDLWVYRP